MIQKGAEDCDGNTSNSEEGTFIVSYRIVELFEIQETLLSEVPEIQDKLNSSMEVCNMIQN